MRRFTRAEVASAARITRGVSIPSEPHQIVRSQVLDVRSHLCLSQAEFAEKFGFDIGDVRRWEAGETPDGLSMYLEIIRRMPNDVELMVDVVRATR